MYQGASERGKHSFLVDITREGVADFTRGTGKTTDETSIPPLSGTHVVCQGKRSGGSQWSGCFGRGTKGRWNGQRCTRKDSLTIMSMCSLQWNRASTEQSKQQRRWTSTFPYHFTFRKETTSLYEQKKACQTSSHVHRTIRGCGTGLLVLSPVDSCVNNSYSVGGTGRAETRFGRLVTITEPKAPTTPLLSSPV